MQFIDRAKIFVRAGDGGDGAVHFRREKYVPAGGPDGGDGGRGGDIILEVDEGLSTLIDFRYRSRYIAESGAPGGGARKFGKDGSDVVIKVPPGTVVRNHETGEYLADLTSHGERFKAARGGRGGRGNAHFATPTRQAPAFSEKGEKGEELWLELELKLIADVGFVGYPNVGKSTLLAQVSAARPKIADYPFTTLVPNLGVVTVGPGESFVAADIPGLIEGASQGVGLGHAFLKHIERTRLIVHIIDAAALDGRDPVEDYHRINEELASFSPVLGERPQLVVANKMDIPGAEDNALRLEKDLGIKVYRISAATGKGVSDLVYAIWSKLRELGESQVNGIEEDGQTEEVAAYTSAKPRARVRDYVITRENDAYVISGEGIDNLMRRMNLQNPESVRWLLTVLGDIGAIDALRKAGAKDGDTVRIGELEFEFVD